MFGYAVRRKCFEKRGRKGFPGLSSAVSSTVCHKVVFYGQPYRVVSFNFGQAES